MLQRFIHTIELQCWCSLRDCPENSFIDITRHVQGVMGVRKVSDSKSDLEAWPFNVTAVLYIDVIR